MKKGRIIDGCLWPAGCIAKLEDIQEEGTQFRYHNHLHGDAIFTTEKGEDGYLAARHPDGMLYSTELDTIEEGCIELIEDEDDEY